MSSDDVDILAIGAHPDDAELGIGGLLHACTRQGLRVTMLDLTQGEMGTRGSPEERAEEAATAGKILGADVRECVGLPDGGVTNSHEQRHALIPFLRRYRPRVIFTPIPPDRHPDHAAAQQLVQDANFLAGLQRIDTGQAPHRATAVHGYHPYTEEQEMPSLVVDISEDFDAKMRALQAHASQFYNPDYPGADTVIASKAFWNSIETRAAYWGSRIGVRYGEALYTAPPLAVNPGAFLNLIR